MNQMLINVSTRKFRRSVRLPTGDVGSVAGDGTSKSAVSRKFVALSSAKLRQWLTSDLSALDLLAIQIDGLHVSDELILVAAVGIDGRGEKHPLGLVEGATENESNRNRGVVQAAAEDGAGWTSLAGMAGYQLVNRSWSVPSTYCRRSCLPPLYGWRIQLRSEHPREHGRVWGSAITALTCRYAVLRAQGQSGRSNCPPPRFCASRMPWTISRVSRRVGGTGTAR